MNRTCLASLAAFCGLLTYWAIPAYAQTTKTAEELLQENQALLRQNEELRARLAQFEQKLTDVSIPKASGSADKEAHKGTAIWAHDPAPEAPAAPSAEAGECCLHQGDEKAPPQDLTLLNFCSAGWNEQFTRRASEDRAPDMALLRVQTNFMEREFRANYADTSNLRSKTRQNLENVDYLIAWAFSRRFMIEVLGNYQWVEGRGTNPDLSGQAARFVGRVQLISTQDSSYSFNFQLISPDFSLGVHETIFSYGVAGFEDLTRFGLYRVGLYTSVLFDDGAGPSNTVGDKFLKALAGPPAVTVRNDVQYDITLAKTLTKPDTPLIGNFTVFVENFAQTNLDGNHQGRTVMSITPGVRFNLGKAPGIELGRDNWLMGGVDIPVAGPKPWDAIYRVTYIKNF